MSEPLRCAICGLADEAVQPYPGPGGVPSHVDGNGVDYPNATEPCIAALRAEVATLTAARDSAERLCSEHRNERAKSEALLLESHRYLLDAETRERSALAEVERLMPDVEHERRRTESFSAMLEQARRDVAVKTNEVFVAWAEIERLREAGEQFLAIADDVAKTAEVKWHRVRKAQEAAALSRAGKVEEGCAAMAALDRSPTVWDFGRTVDELAEAAAAWRAARGGT
jgi:hypothetical protein